MMQVENDLDKSQEELTAATSQLEEKEKKVQEVLFMCLYFIICVGICQVALKKVVRPVDMVIQTRPIFFNCLN